MRSTLEELGMQVVDVVSTAADGLAAARRLRPDLILLDIGLPDENGISVGKRIISELPDSRVVVVTAHKDPRSVAEAVRVGFQGYVTKDTPVSLFVSSIQAVIEGHVVLPRQLARQAAGARTPGEKDVALLIEQITHRERDVLQLLAEGASSAEMARRLSVSRNTVRTHVQNILTKLQVHSRLEAAAFAVRHGLVKAGRSQAS
jgi:two-component system nitrate/nitrite response regulator NarL